MKKRKLKNKLAGYTGNFLLYSYRVFMAAKGTEEVKITPAKGHVLFNSNHFKTPCYN